jgi:hypothetical protein
MLPTTAKAARAARARPRTRRAALKIMTRPAPKARGETEAAAKATTKASTGLERLAHSARQASVPRATSKSSRARPWSAQR